MKFVVLLGAWLVAQPVWAQEAIVDARHRGEEGARVGKVRTYRTIGRALAAVPAHNKRPHVILIRKGRYYEKLAVTKPQVQLRGEHRDSTVLTYDAAAGHPKPGGGTWGTPGSATLRIAAPDFQLSTMTVANGFDYMANYRKPNTDSTKLTGSQGVAVFLDQGSDRAVFRDCTLTGHQDTLHPNAGRAFFHRCTITGSVDFIFGAGRAVFYDSDIISLDRGSKSNNGYVTAPSTHIKQPYGLIFVDSRLRKESASMAAGSVTLGRAWHPAGDPDAAGTAVFINTFMDDHIGGKGWDVMFSTNAAGVRTEHKPEDHRFYEFNSRGPGAVQSPSRRQLRAEEAARFTIARIFDGWIPSGAPTGSPVPQSEPLLSAARLATLSPDQRAQWHGYLTLSRQMRQRDRDSLAAELHKLGRDSAVSAPLGRGFFVTDDMTPEWFRSNEAKRLADAIVSFQTPSGGWSKRIEFNRVRAPGMAFVSQGNANWVGTLDNGATTEQLKLLAGVIAAHNEARSKRSFARGIDYLLVAQMPNGCWPQVFPLVGSYHDAITFNDDATVHALEVLRDAMKQPWLSGEQRALAGNAVTRGVECILATQFTVNGKKTVWGAQHDPLTLEPIKARAYEHASLSGRESANVLNFLMALENPTPAIVSAVHSGAAWFKEVAIRDFEYVPRGLLTSKPGAGPLWARFYEIGTNRPIFSDRDGVVRYNLSEIGEERRTGYLWYTDEPATTLRRYERWAARR